MLDAFRNGLKAQEIRYLDLVNAANGKPPEQQLAMFWEDENTALYRSVESALIEVASDRAVQISIATGNADMWAVVNEEIIDWVGEYYQSFDPSFVGSIPNLNVTSRTLIGQVFNDWQRGEIEGFGAADGLPQLIRALEPAFGVKRAKTVGVTETTRIFNESTIVAGRANPLITRYRFFSAADDRVCFPADTLVETGTGDRRIQDIRIGELVWTRQGLQRVLAVSAREYDGYVTMIDSTVGHVTATVNHPFWTVEDGWVACEKLSNKHTLRAAAKDVFVVGVFTFRLDRPIMVYNLEVQGVPEFYANGILVHNCPICGPLHNSISSANKDNPTFNHPSLGSLPIPPLHVNCRCQAVPETDVTLQFDSDLPRPYTWSPETPAEYAKRRRDELRGVTPPKPPRARPPEATLPPAPKPEPPKVERISNSRRLKEEPYAIPYKSSSEVMARALAENDKMVNTLSSAAGVSPVEYEKVVISAVENAVVDINPSIRSDANSAISIIKDGRFKSQFESGKSGGGFSPKIRRDAEEWGLGVPRDIKAEQHPIYGYFKTPEHGATAYGNVEFVLKNEVRQRTTITVGDSLGGFLDKSTVGSPLNSITKASFADPYAVDEMYKAGKISEGYIEAQIHGGVTVDDVFEVIIHRDADYNRVVADKLEVICREKGIKVSYSDEAD